MMLQSQELQFTLFILVVLSGIAICEGHWNYGHEDTWPQLCREGKRQSPIAIERRRALKKNYNALIFKNYHKVYSSVLKNNGHSAEVKLKTEEALTIEGGGLPEVYVLDHLHFHWQSEHVIESYRYPLELHMVHYGKSHRNLSNAVQHDKGVAVFSVLFDLSPDDDVEFTSLIALLEKLKETPDEGETLQDFHVHDYIPRDTAGFYRYSGSLTTPKCNEGVIWTIFTNTLPISESQVKTFHSVKTEEHKELTKNYRTLQKLNGRNVYLKISPIHKSSGGASSSPASVSIVIFTLYTFVSIVYLTIDFL